METTKGDKLEDGAGEDSIYVCEFSAVLQECAAADKF